MNTKAYELTNHLGNVLVTVSDARVPLNASGSVSGYTAIVKSATDYSAFGAPMAGRTYTSAAYRYGFNGKENDPETVGTGKGLQDYGMRIYNPGLGRFLSNSSKFPWYTPFQFAGNKPTFCVDFDGLEEVNYEVLKKNDDGSVVVRIYRTPGSTATSNKGVLLIHNLNDGRTYNEFEYAELNQLFGLSPTNHDVSGIVGTGPAGPEDYFYLLPTSEDDWRTQDPYQTTNGTDTDPPRKKEILLTVSVSKLRTVKDQGGVTGWFDGNKATEDADKIQGITEGIFKMGVNMAFDDLNSKLTTPRSADDVTTVTITVGTANYANLNTPEFTKQITDQYKN